MEHDEILRRRKEREAARQMRNQKQKKLYIKLALAGVAVLATVAVILVLAFGSKSPSQTPQPTNTVMQTELSSDSSTPDTTQPPTTVIHLAAAGDLNVTPDIVAAGGIELDYTELFMDIVPALAQADVTVLNLEGGLYGVPYGQDRSAPLELLQSLDRGGVDVIQLANSYSIYNGMDGLRSTISGVRSAGMEPVGAFATATDAKDSGGYTLLNVNGIRIAFIAFTKGMDGMALPPGNEACVNVLYEDYASDYQKVDTQGITRLMEAVAKEKPDLTVALVHWGSEFNNTVSATQQEICSLLQKNGADAIIGTHSHYVQQMTLDPETGNFVAWSLGDFTGDAPRAGSEYSVILDLEITRDNKSGDTRITNFSYTPIFTVAEENKPMKIMRIDTAIAAYDGGYLDRVSQETYDAMKYALERIDARIQGQ